MKEGTRPPSQVGAAVVPPTHRYPSKVTQEPWAAYTARLAMLVLTDELKSTASPCREAAVNKNSTTPH